MNRCIHTLACLTVLATAMPQGWCCWLVPIQCCQGRSQLFPSSPDASLSHASCSNCRSTTERQSEAASFTSESADDDSHHPTGQHHPTRHKAPSDPPSTKECCQRALAGRTTSVELLSNPLLVLASQIAIGALNHIGVLPSEIATHSIVDSLRLHARLSRWLC